MPENEGSKKKGNFNRENDDSPLKFGVPYLLTSPNMMISYYIPYILAEMSPYFCGENACGYPSPLGWSRSQWVGSKWWHVKDPNSSRLTMIRRHIPKKGSARWTSWGFSARHFPMDILRHPFSARSEWPSGLHNIPSVPWKSPLDIHSHEMPINYSYYPSNFDEKPPLHVDKDPKKSGLDPVLHRWFCLVWKWSWNPGATWGREENDD